jgi:hypothetical protein
LSDEERGSKKLVPEIRTCRKNMQDTLKNAAISDLSLSNERS